MAEYIGSFVFNAPGLLYPIIETRYEITPDGTPIFLLPVIKYRIQEYQFIGTSF